MKNLNYFFINTETSKNKKYSSVLNAQLSTKKLVGNSITYTNWSCYENVSDATFLVMHFAPQYFFNWEVVINGVIFYGDADNPFSFIHVIASNSPKKLSQVKMKMTREDFLKLDKAIFAGFDKLDPNKQMNVRIVHDAENIVDFNLFLVSSEPLKDTSIRTAKAMSEFANKIQNFPPFQYIEITITFNV